MKLSMKSLISLKKYWFFDEIVYGIIGVLMEISFFDESVYPIIGFLKDMFVLMKLCMKSLVS